MGSSVDLRAEEHAAFAEWIEAERPESERNAHADVVGYLAAEIPAKVIVENGKWVCGCYFRILPGGVATLAGLRYEPGHEKAAVGLLREVTDVFDRDKILQVQAITPSIDGSGAYQQRVATALHQAGFSKLTQIQHRYLDQLPSSTPKIEVDTSQISLRPFHQLTRKRAVKLVGETFEGTLDCPALDEIRTADEYLTGFLEGTKLRQQKNWYVLCQEGMLIGCLLLKSHGQAALEINYFGVVPSARGKKLGEFLISSAINLARHAGISIVVAAVDEDNGPAVKHYDRFGFAVHRRLDVWLYDSSSLK